MRKLGWGLGLLLSGGLIGLLTMPGWLPGLIHRQAQHWAEETHHRLVIGSLEVGVFPFRVHAHAVRLYEADGQTLVGGCEDLDGHLVLHSGLRPIPVIDELTLTHPVVHLVRSPAGEWNLARLAGPSSGGGFPLLVEKVRIVRGEGSVWDQGKGIRHDIRNLQFEIPRLSFRNKDTWLFPSLHAEVDGASIALVAQIRPFSSRLRGEGDLSIRGFDLMRMLAPWVPPWSVSPGVLTTHFAFWGSDWSALQGELSGLHWTTDQVRWRGAGLEGVQLSAQVKKLAWPASFPLSLTLQVGAQGQIQMTGPVDPAARTAHLAVHVQHLDLRPFQPWLAAYAQVRLEHGQLSSEGVLDGTFSAQRLWQGRYRGQVRADELAVREGRRGRLLWRSKSLFAQGEATLNPLHLTLDQLAFGDFYARLHLLPDATLNWGNLLNSLPVPSKLAGSPPPRETVRPEGSSVAAQEAAVVIRKVTLRGGTIHYRDDYVHPSYEADLTGLGGEIDGLSSAEDTTARLELRGRVHDAPLLIEGQINPLAQNLFLDMTAQVNGMDLAQFSPYSGKYVGYDIERGKLSFDAHYSVKNHDLQATNHLVLNELTFGKPVASPGITHFPVALAVSLLQDPQGRITMNLPIAGSLDDPRFSVGGVLARTLVQVLEKAVESLFVH